MNNQEVDQEDLHSLDVDTQTETSLTPDPQPIASPVLPPKPKKRAFIIILVFLILAGAGAAVYYYFFQAKPTTKVSQIPTTTTNTTPQAATDTTDYAKQLISKVAAAETPLTSTYPNTKIDSETSTSAPAYKYGSNDYYIATAQSYNLTITNPNAKDSTSPVITASESAANTALSAEKELTKTTSDYSAIYKNTNVICTVSANTQPAYISCANTRDYKQAADAIAPFAKVFFLGEGTIYESSTVLSTPRITKKSNGYENAIVSVNRFEGVGGYAGLFYGQDDQWIYWKGSQSELSCSDYDIHALQAAFEGDQCYDDAAKTDSVVKITR